MLRNLMSLSTTMFHLTHNSYASQDITMFRFSSLFCISLGITEPILVSWEILVQRKAMLGLYAALQMSLLSYEESQTKLKLRFSLFLGVLCVQGHFYRF